MIILENCVEILNIKTQSYCYQRDSGGANNSGEACLDLSATSKKTATGPDLIPNWV